MTHPFHSIYSHGFVRAAVAVPFVRVADPEYNVEHTLTLAKRASEMRAAIALFPELGISAYSNEDLFHQDALLAACRGILVESMLGRRARYASHGRPGDVGKGGIRRRSL